MGVFISVLFTMPGILENITSIQETSSEVKVLEDSIHNTNVKIVDLEAEAGSIMVNFTLNNNGTEKLWDYEHFNLLITYDADIGGVKTPVTEEFIYSESLVLPVIKIQRGVTVFGGAGETTTTRNIDPVISFGNDGNAFVRITNVQYTSAVPDAGTTSVRNDDDIGARAQLTDLDEITFTRLASAIDEDVRVAWEVWEYVGAAGDNNEFIVRLDTEVTTPDDTPVNTNIPSFDDRNNLVPFLTGVTNTGSTTNWDNAVHTAEITDPGGGLADVTLDRDGPSATSVVGVVVVEFTGIHWKIQNNIVHTFLTSSIETESISPVNSWDEAFITSSFHSPDGQTERDEIAAIIWPSPNDDEINFDLDVSVGGLGTGQYIAIAHVVENHEMTIQHIDTVTGGAPNLPAGPGGAHTVISTVNQVNAMSETGLISTILNLNGGGTYPRPFFNYQLIADDTVEFFRGRSASGGSEAALQVIQFPPAEKAGTGPCFNGNIRNDLWTIDSITNDQLNPGMLNRDESAEICSGLLYPIFSNGDISVILSTDKGIISSTATTVS